MATNPASLFSTTTAPNPFWGRGNPGTFSGTAAYGNVTPDMLRQAIAGQNAGAVWNPDQGTYTDGVNNAWFLPVQGRERPLQVLRRADGSYHVTEEPGDVGRGWLGNNQTSKWNDVPYDIYDANFNLQGSNKFFGMEDAGTGSWMAPAIMLSGYFGGGALANAAGQAGLGAGASAMAPGSAAFEAAQLGIGGTGALGGAPAAAGGLGATAFEGYGVAPGMGAEGVGTASMGAGGLTPELGAFEGYGVAPGMGSQLPATLPPPVAGGGGGLSLGGLGSGGSLIPGVSNSQLLGGAASLLGGAAGGGLGGGSDGSTSRELPDFLRGPVTEDLIPRTQSLLASQSPAAQAAGASMMTAGTGLLNAGVSPNGVGKVTMDDVQTNPWLTARADDISRRTTELLGQNNIAIQGNAVGSGALGGSRQGVAQGLAASKAADYLQGNLASLYGQAYESDRNRAVSKYGIDTNFYGQQRQQDLAGMQLGGSMLQNGLNTQWGPINQATQTYSPFTGFGQTTNNAGSDSKWQNAIGTGLAIFGSGKNMGWW